MRTNYYSNYYWRNIQQATLALLAGLCALAIGLDARFARVAAGQEQEPVFSEIPGVTTPVPPPTADAPEPVANLAPAPPATAAVSPGPTTAPPAKQPTANGSAPEDQTNGKTLYAFQATDLDLKAALATFARANNLNIIPDNDVAGTVTLDVRNLPLHTMMRALLEASDCTWQEEGGLIRVHGTDTRMFYVDYLRLSRIGLGKSSATLNSATYSGGGGGGGGSGGGGASAGGSAVNLTADNQIDFWKEIKDELNFMLTPAGRNSLAINKTAGIIQITDRPSALKKVQDYLNGVEKNIHRQVEIEVKIYDVTLNDQFQFGIDWVHIAEAYGGSMAFGGLTQPQAIGGAGLQSSAVAGLNSLGFGSADGIQSLVFKNFNTAAAVNALKQQGNVQVVSQPRIRALNNQTALIKVGTELPFFAQNVTSIQAQSGNQTFTGDQITTITVGTILYITPQISGDDFISLDMSPVLTSLVKTDTSPSKTATAPELDTEQASTLVRVHDADTVVIGGLIQTQKARNDTKIPVLGDIPWLGKLFTGTFRYNQKKELVFFVTPHIVREGSEPAVASKP